MFDSYRLGGASYSSSTITEVRAPTDDSIRLAKEYEEKVKKEIVASYVFDNPNEVSGNAVVFDNPLQCGKDVWFRFVLNGEEFEFKKFISDHTLFDKRVASEMLFKAFSEQLYQELISKLKVQ